MKILLITGDILPCWASTIRANELKNRWQGDNVDVVGTFNGNSKDYDIIHILYSGGISRYLELVSNNPNTIFTSVASLRTLENMYDDDVTLKSIYQNSKKIVAFNPILKQKTIELIGNNYSDKVVYIPNGVDEKLFNRKFTVGFVCSNLSYEYKGLPIIKQACDNLGIDLLITKCDYPNTVTPHNEMPDFYNKIDCLCIASLGEGTNNPTMEALAMNKPVISTKTGIAEELQGLILVERTVEGIMKGIEKLLPRKQILEKYTWDIIAKQYYGLYHG